MNQPHQSRPASPDIDLPTLGRALWRAKTAILGLSIGAGVLTFIVLSMMRPLYTSEARILIQNEESVFTRPADGQVRDVQQRTLDEQAVQSQVQVLTSRDLADEVINDLDLTTNPDFAKDAGTNPVIRLLNSVGLAKGSAKSQEEKAVGTFVEYLSVFPLFKSSVIAVNYTSGDANLAAKVANKLADVYINWQREAKLEQTKDATAWLSAQIDVLRQRVAEAEEAAERFRSSEGLFSGTNNNTLSAQQLSELNSQVILAKAQKSEAEARARLIKKMIADKADIDATPEVLKSELITRLIDQRVQVQRQLAELSATLLPSHPRIKQLASELADVRRQIRDEALKIVNGLENEAEVASARESSLRGSLNEVKTQASGQSDAEVKLRALEREAKAQRDLLESYLARYRDASARHDMGSVPAQATIVSRAHASILPSFPKRGPLSLLVAVATALLALTYILARELIGAPAETCEPARAAEPRVRDRRRTPPAEPEPVPAAASTVPATPLAPAAKVTQPTTTQRKPEPAVAAPPKVGHKAEPAAADMSPAARSRARCRTRRERPPRQPPPQALRPSRRPWPRHAPRPPMRPRRPNPKPRRPRRNPPPPLNPRQASSSACAAAWRPARRRPPPLSRKADGLAASARLAPRRTAPMTTTPHRHQRGTCPCSGPTIFAITSTRGSLLPRRTPPTIRPARVARPRQNRTTTKSDRC